MKFKVKEATVTVISADDGPIACSQEEANDLVKYVEEKYHLVVDTLTVLIVGEELELSWVPRHIPFERIRRITGYLVGTMDHWNDAKTAEEKDRVKHDVTPMDKLE